MTLDEDKIGAMRRIAVNGLVERLSPPVAEIVRQDLIQSVGNALRLQQRQGQAALQNIGHALRYQLRMALEAEQLDEFVQAEVMKSEEWGNW